MTKIVSLLQQGAFLVLLLLACLFSGTASAGAPPSAPPQVKSFVIPATHRTLTVPIIRFTATDDVAVTGYLITEDGTAPSAASPGWTVAPPAFHTFSTEGANTIYAWVKDADGSVSSSLSASIVVGAGEARTRSSIAAGGYHTAAL